MDGQGSRQGLGERVEPKVKARAGDTAPAGSSVSGQAFDLGAK